MDEQLSALLILVVLSGASIFFNAPNAISITLVVLTAVVAFSEW